MLAMCATALLAASCGNEMPEEDKDNLSNGGFRIEVTDLNSSHCKVKVTPEDMNTQYFCGVATEDYLKTFGPMEDMMTTATNFIETMILENSDVAMSDLMKKGIYEREVTGLQPDQRFVVFACHTDNTGAIISDIEAIVETTPALEASENTFEIEVDQITATSAMLFITPSTDDEYVWMEFPQWVYKDMTMEEFEEFLLKNYKPFFSLHATSGEMVHSFDGKLDPDTEYMIIVFGYDGGVTTELTTCTFRTLPPNDPTDVTFTFEYETMTSRSVSVTFKPSDSSVSYLAIVADEASLERKGGPNAEGVKELIDQQIKNAIEKGDCEDRAEFLEFYAHRGNQNVIFSLKPGMKHYACAVCMDAEGYYASEVAIDEFTAPSEDETNAAVTASVLKYFDGDALKHIDSEFAGWAVVRLKFELSEAADNAIYTIYPTSILEEEGATDERIREMLLDNDLLGVYNFPVQSLEDVQLEWGYDYKLFAIAFDKNENAGEMFTLDIPALSKAGASPADQF